MYILLVREGCPAIHIPDVTLHEGYQPSIGDIKTDLLDSVEPARWFKTLIIDYMTIDCTKRLVKWSMDGDMSNNTKNNSKRSSRVLFSEGEFYDYEAKCDEVFDTISTFFDREGETTTLVDIGPKLIKMLHCQLLPNINLNQDDLPKLEEALIKQEIFIQKLEGKVKELMNTLSLHDDCLLKHRKAFIDRIHENPSILVNFDFSMLEILKEHIVKDCQKLSKDLDRYEDAVVMAKTAVEGNPDDKRLKWEIDRKRLVRDSFVEEQYLNVISVREMVSEYLVDQQKSLSLPAGGTDRRIKRKSLGIHSKKRKSMPKDVEGNNLQLLTQLYVSTSQMRAEAKEKMKNLVTRKVLMVSVKEALLMTIKDLRSGKQSAGEETERGYSAFYSTDVLNRSTIPLDWLTFEDKITKMVNDASHEVGAMHAEFCEKVVAICNAAYEEEAYYRALESLPAEEQWTLQVPAGTTRWFSRDGSSDMDDYILVSDVDASPTRKATDKLKSSVKQHFDKICPVIHEYLQTGSRNKAWVAYENSFYEALLNEYILPLYQVAYSDCVETLKMQATNLTVDDLEIEERWILDMLVKRRDSGFESGHEQRNLADLQTKTSTCYGALMEFIDLHQMFSPESETHELKSSVCDNGAAGGKVLVEEFGNATEANTEVDTTTNDSDIPLPEDVDLSVLSSDMNAVQLSGNGSLLSKKEADANSKVDTANGSDLPLQEDGALCVLNGDLNALQLSRDSFMSENIGALLQVVDTCSILSKPSSYESGVSLETEKSIDSQATVPSSASDLKSSNLSTHPQSTVSESICSNEVLEFNVQSQKFRNIFEAAFKCLSGMEDEPTPLKKMQLLTRCLRAITTALSKQESSGSMAAPCADELVTVLVVLILNLTPDLMSRLYVDLKFIIDLMAPFLESGVHSYSVVQFEVAFQYIFTRLMKIKNHRTQTTRL